MKIITAALLNKFVLNNKIIDKYMETDRKVMHGKI